MAPEKTLIRLWCELFTGSLWGAAVLAFCLPPWALPLLLLGELVAPSLAVWGVRRFRDWRDRELS